MEHLRNDSYRVKKFKFEIVKLMFAVVKRRHMCVCPQIWDKQTLECLKILTGHTGSVLCLQYDERVIVTGSSDSTVRSDFYRPLVLYKSSVHFSIPPPRTIAPHVCSAGMNKDVIKSDSSCLFFLSPRVWDVNSGEVLNTLIHHNEAVLHLRFCNGLMVTCSKDRSIAVWDMASPTDISLRRVLVGHRAAVNVVDFDDKYIVSASGDRTIKVSTSVCYQLSVKAQISALGVVSNFSLPDPNTY